MKPWKLEKSKYLQKNRWLTLRADKCVTADGVVVDPYYVMEHADWVHIIAIDANNRILVLRQYRHPVESVCLEIPGGEMEEGETPLEAAKRELLEETGCEAESYEYMGSFFPNPARQSNQAHNFLAKGVKQVCEPNQDITENIQWQFIEVPELLKTIDAGEFPHALHIAAVLSVLRKF